MWKNLLYFTRRERSGIVFLTIFIICLFIGKHFFIKPQNELPEILGAPAEAELSERIDSGSNRRTYFEPVRKHEQKKPAVAAQQRTYFDNQQGKDIPVKNGSTPKKYPVVEKYPEGTKIDINLADTTSLMKIPGIGHSYATRILKFRRLLGGYYSIEQLKEVYGMYEELYDKIIPFFEVSCDSIVLIPINKASLDCLNAHPYIDFYQAKAILEMRKKKGRIQNINELSLLDEFTVDDLDRVKNYLSFD